MILPSPQSIVPSPRWRQASLPAGEPGFPARPGRGHGSEGSLGCVSPSLSPSVFPGGKDAALYVRQGCLTLRDDYERIAEKVKSLTMFCLERRGRCFGGFTPAQLFRYVAFQLLNGHLFADMDETENVRAVLFVWPEREADIRRRDAAGEPQFAWRMGSAPGPGAANDGPVVGTNARGSHELMVPAARAVSGARPRRTAAGPALPYDSFLIGQVIGSRQLLPKLVKQAMAHWPDSPRKKLFTYRLKNGTPRLTEYPWPIVKRFAYGLSQHS